MIIYTKLTWLKKYFQFFRSQVTKFNLCHIEIVKKNLFNFTD